MQGESQSARARTNLGRSTQFHTLSSEICRRLEMFGYLKKVAYQKWYPVCCCRTRSPTESELGGFHPNLPMQYCVLTQLAARSTPNIARYLH